MKLGIILEWNMILTHPMEVQLAHAISWEALWAMEHPRQVEMYGQHAAKVASRLIIIPLSSRALGAWKVCIFYLWLNISLCQIKIDLKNNHDLILQSLIAVSVCTGTTTTTKAPSPTTTAAPSPTTTAAPSPTTTAAGCGSPWYVGNGCCDDENNNAGM